MGVGGGRVTPPFYGVADGSGVAESRSDLRPRPDRSVDVNSTATFMCATGFYGVADAAGFMCERRRARVRL